MGLRLHSKYCLLLAIILTVYFVFISYNSKSNITKKIYVNLPVREVINRHFFSQDNISVKNLPNEINEYRKNYIKNMMKTAFSNYKLYAWGENELRPISKIGHSASVFGRSSLGASIVDGIDTLYIMSLMQEYKDARNWVETSFNMKLAEGDISVFETNIRFVGGFLSIYALTGDKLFLDKAREVADLLLPAFKTTTGIPLALINMKTGKAVNYGWASGGCSILSEFGSLELEFDYLSRVTRNLTYVNKTRHIRQFLNGLEKIDNLYPIYLNPKTGKFCLKHYSVGALGDSFYEYLLKIWLLNNKTDTEIKKVYDVAIKAIEEKMLKISKPSNLWYFVEIKNSRIEHKMDHLACFIAAMFALQSKHENKTAQVHYLELAKQIGNTCHEGYIRSETRIGPESMHFINQQEATTNNKHEMYYILRPEVVEAWFVLYRITGDPIYREWSWEMVLSLEKYCLTSYGYSGIRNVYDKNTEKDDVQQSFFFSETLKYLYLTFSDPSIISLDKYVFNTEAHPFPILNTTFN